MPILPKLNEDSKSIPRNIFIVYLANPDQAGKPSTRRDKYPETRSASGSDTTLSVSVHLPVGLFSYEWYNLRTGKWSGSGTVDGGSVTLEAPGNEDCVLLLREK